MLWNFANSIKIFNSYMNTLRSHFHHFSNNWVTVQNRLRTIHQTLLECLEEENAWKGRENYRPGKVHLIEKNVWNGSSVLSRLMVSRNAVDIYRSELPFPEQRILATFGGKYQVLDWLSHEIRGEKIHIPYRQIPAVLEKFASQYNWSENDSRIQFSLVS